MWIVAEKFSDTYGQESTGQLLFWYNGYEPGDWNDNSMGMFHNPVCTYNISDM